MKCMILQLFQAFVNQTWTNKQCSWAVFVQIPQNQFKPTKAGLDISISDIGANYDYLCVCMDNLFLKETIYQFILMCFNLKGVEQPDYCLGGDMEIDKNGKMAYYSKKRM